jgi:hypothetical protein
VARRSSLGPTESQFQEQIIHLAQLQGWLVAHFRPARTKDGWRTAVQADGQGFPDLVLVRGDRILYREIKSDTGVVSPFQIRWGEALGGAGGDWSIWRPKDWSTIVETLKGS